MNICIAGNYFLTISNQIFNLIWLINMFTLGIREMSDYSISVIITYYITYFWMYMCVIQKQGSSCHNEKTHEEIITKPLLSLLINAQTVSKTWIYWKKHCFGTCQLTQLFPKHAFSTPWKHKKTVRSYDILRE